MSDPPRLKSAWLWIADFGPYAKPTMRICPDLFFSSRKVFADLYGCLDVNEQQLVEVKVPEDFDHWDFIPDNY